MKMNWKKIHSGVTLYELTILLLVLAGIFAVLFPIYKRNQDKSQRSICFSNQRSIVISMIADAQDHDNTFIVFGVRTWYPLSVDTGELMCPALGKKYPIGYGYNYALAGLAMQRLVHPQQTLLTADCHPTAPEPNIIQTASDIDFRHVRKAVASYADGHVASIDDSPGLLVVELHNKKP